MLIGILNNQFYTLYILIEKFKSLSSNLPPATVLTTSFMYDMDKSRNYSKVKRYKIIIVEIIMLLCLENNSIFT